MKSITAKISMALAILFCLSGSAGNGCESTTGTIDSNSAQDPAVRHIIDGEPTNYETWKGVVGVIWGLACTGTLIDPEIVLTAAHCGCVWPDCVSPRNKGTVTIGGGADLNKETIEYARNDTIVLHPDWTGRNATVDPESVDISIYKLDTPVTAVDYYGVRKSALTSSNLGDEGVIVGYGMSVTGDDSTRNVHRMGRNRILSVESNVFELGEGDANQCHGDSGGPFFADEGGEWVVSGTSTYGTYWEGDVDVCILDGFAWDVNIGTYRAWIEDTVKALTGHDLVDPPSGDADTDTDTDADTDADTDSGDDDDDNDDDDDDNDDNNDDESDGEDPESDDSGCGCKTAGIARPSVLGLMISEL